MKKRIVAIVTSDKADKTAVVTLSVSKTHPIYKKRYKTSQKFHAHDEKNEAKIGDVIEIEESRPLSKKKSWVLVKILQKAKE